MGQRFGLGHVVDVLRGADSERIRQLGHDRLSTYGIGREQSRETWAGLLRQLIHLGYLQQDVGNFSVLRLTEAARPLLRGEKSLTLARPRLKAVAKKAGKNRDLPGEADPALFQRLRLLRKELADAAGVPPFVIFGDATLVEMAARQPGSDEELLAVNGVGRVKLQRYGSLFLEAIRGHARGG